MSDDNDYLLKYLEQHEKQHDDVKDELRIISSTLVDHKIILERLSLILEEHQKRSLSLEELVQIHKTESEDHHKAVDIRLEELEKPLKFLSLVRNFVIKLAPFLGGLVTIYAALRYFGIV